MSVETPSRRRLTNQQMDAIATAVETYPGRFGINIDRVEDRATCDSLVERGSLDSADVPEGQDVDAAWYRLSDELATALAIKVEQSLIHASLN